MSARRIVTVTSFQIYETVVVFSIMTGNVEAAPASSEKFPNPVRHFFFSGPGSGSRPASAFGLQRWQFRFKFITVLRVRTLTEAVVSATVARLEDL